MPSIHYESTYSDRKLREGVKRSNQTVNDWAKNANVQGQSVQQMFNNVAKAAAGLASVGFAVRMGKEITAVRGEWQKYEAVLTNTLGSNEQAGKSMDMLAGYAAKTNFQLNEVTDSYVKLVNNGFKPAKEEIRSLGDLAASKAKGFNQLTEAIIDAETFEFERLKEFGIRASKNGEQVTFTFKGIKTTVDAASESIRDYIISLGDLEGVKGSTEAISKTLVGMVSNFEDAYDKMLNTLGKDNQGMLVDIVKGGTKLVENYEKVIDTLKVLVATYGAYKAASIVNNILNQTEAAGSLTKALKNTAVAQHLLNAAQKASPVGLAFAGITALIGGYTLWQRHLKKTNSFTVELNKSITDEVIKLDSLFKRIKSTSEGTKERADAIKLTNDRYGNYLSNLLTEKSSLDDIEKAQRNATNALIANISVQQSKDKLSEVLGEITNKFDKEFDGFIKKFGEVYGTDRIPEFVVAINDAIDDEIKAGGGQVERGMLEYSSIAKDAYDKFIKEISQKTGFLKYSFKDFQESFMDFAGFKAEKSGFIGQLEGMIAAYQGMVDKFREGGDDDSGGSNTQSKSKDIKNEINDLYSQLGTANESERKAIAERILLLQKELILRRQIAESAVKAVRDEKPPAKIKSTPQNIFLGNTKPLKDVTLQFDKLNKKIEEGILRAKEMQDELKLKNSLEYLFGASEVLGAMSNAIAEIDTELADAVNKMADLAYNAGNLTVNMSSGNIFGAVASGISIAGNVLSLLIDDAIEKEELLRIKAEQVKQMFELQNKQLEEQLRILDQSTGEGRIHQEKKTLELINQQTQSLKDEAREMYVLEERIGKRGNRVTSRWKFGSIDNLIGMFSRGTFLKDIESGSTFQNLDELEKLVDEYYYLIDARKELLEELTQTTSQNISDTIAEGFMNGKKALEDFTGDFETLMKDALINSFKTKYLNSATSEFFELFGSLSDGGLTSGEIDQLGAKWGELITNASNEFEELSKIFEQTGISLIDDPPSSQSGLIGSIRRDITEETAGELAGIWRRTTDDTRQIRDYTYEGVKHMAAIEANTHRTAEGVEQSVVELQNAVDKLDKIVSNTSNNNQSTYDLGVG